MSTISINNLAHAIYDSSKGKEGEELDQLITNTTHFLAEKHLLGKAPQVIEALEKIINIDEGIVRATISSKEKLQKKMVAEVEEIVKKRYKAKDVYLSFIEDKKLLGGIKIEVGDEVINMTLKNKLDKLQNYLIAS